MTKRRRKKEEAKEGEEGRKGPKGIKELRRKKKKGMKKGGGSLECIWSEIIFDRILIIVINLSYKIGI